MRKYCPHCKEELSSLDYNASYTETIYGISYGTCNLEGRDTESIDRDPNPSDSFDETDFEYKCSNCGESVELDELLDSLEGGINNYNLRELKKV